MLSISLLVLAIFKFFIMLEGQVQVIAQLSTIFSQTSKLGFVFYVFNFIFAYLYYLLGNITGGHPDSGHGDGDDFEYFGFASQNHLFPMFLWSYKNVIGELESPNGKVWHQMKELGLSGSG